MVDSFLRSGVEVGFPRRTEVMFEERRGWKMYTAATKSGCPVYDVGSTAKPFKIVHWTQGWGC